MPRFHRCFPAFCALATLLTGCAEPPAEVDVYQVRGVVTALPQPDQPASSLMVHHEAIPSFIGHDGTNAPMPEMTMAFPTAAGVALDGLEVGDKVQLRMEVTRGQGYQATEVLPLAGDLELELHAPDPTDAHADHDPTGHDHASH